MIRKNIDECIKLTELILTEHFCQGVKQDTLKKHIYKDCLWIGSIAEEYTRGKEKILATLFKESGKLPAFTLTSKKFDCISHDRKTAVIAGCYIGHTVNDSREVYRDMQRVTFVWKEIDDFLFLVHFHVSNPLINVQKDEGFPHILGAYTREYIDSILLENNRKMITVKDDFNSFQRISIVNVLYIESFDKKCLIHLKDTEVLARISLCDFMVKAEKIAPNMIVRVQKSFAVNKYYINSIKRYEMIVASKYAIPISRKKYSKVEEELWGSSE